MAGRFRGPAARRSSVAPCTSFARIFRELENEHYHQYFVERDTQVDPPRTAATGYTYLRGLRGRRRRRRRNGCATNLTNPT